METERDGGRDGGVHRRVARQRCWLLVLSALIQNCIGDHLQYTFYEPLTRISALLLLSRQWKTYALVSAAASTHHVLLFAANTMSSEQPNILTIIYINNNMKQHILSLGLKNLK